MSPGSHTHTRLAPPSPQAHHSHSHPHPHTPKKRSAEFGGGFSSYLPSIPVPERKGSLPSILTPSLSLPVPTSSSTSNPVPVPAPAHAHAPPTIIEPTQPATSDKDTSKRFSQIVHREGFVLRLTNYSRSSANLQLQLGVQKNWKPFKAVLKGSKMYFYKPPGDRSTGIKELFPSGVVGVSEEAEDAEDADGVVNGSGNVGTGGVGRDREEARKRRAFWGRRMHPELVVKEGKVVKGTFEALVHEAVFGYSFPEHLDSFTLTSSTAATDSTQSSDTVNANNDNATVNSESAQTTTAYKTFATTILLVLPTLIERAKVEFEFIRCAAYLVSGSSAAKDNKKQQDSEYEDQEQEESTLTLKLRKNVAWLAGTYLALHGKPVDEEPWKAFCEETIPGFILEEEGGLSGFFVSTQTPTSIAVDQTTSPNLNTFSPRPHSRDKLPTFNSSALHLQTPSSSSTRAVDVSVTPARSTKASSGATPTPTPKSRSKSRSHPHSHSHTRGWMTALSAHGLTREVFLKIEVETLARSLSSYHRAILFELVGDEAKDDKADKLTAKAFFRDNFSGISTNGDGDDDSEKSEQRKIEMIKEFCGCDEAPHWLTLFVIGQILGPSSAVPSQSHSYSHSHPHSHAHAHNIHLRDRSNSNSGSTPGPGPGASDDHLAPSPIASSFPFTSPSHFPLPSSSSGTGSSSRTHVRSELISRWIRVADHCRLIGDEASWRAIMCALCSRPIARLEKAWKRAETGCVACVKAWVYPASSVEGKGTGDVGDAGSARRHSGLVGVEEPRLTPWCGETRYRAVEAVAKLRERSGGANEWQYGPMEKVMSWVSEFWRDFSLGAEEGRKKRDLTEDEDVMKLVEVWRACAKAPRTKFSR